MLSSCPIFWRIGKGEVGCLSLRAGGRSLWGSVLPSVQHLFLQKILKQIIRHLEGSREGVAANMDLSNRSYFLMWQGDRSCWQKQMHVWSRRLPQSAHRQAQQVCGLDRSTAWWPQNRLENISQRVPVISSLSKWKVWSRRARQEAAKALWLLSVFGSKANGADDGLENGPVAFTDSSKSCAPSVVLGAVSNGLIYMRYGPPKKKKKHVQFNRSMSKVQLANAREGLALHINKSINQKNLETIVDRGWMWVYCVML